MAVFLGLFAALSFGSGDFIGGYASRRSNERAVLLTVNVVALLIAIPIIAVAGDPFPPAASLGAAVSAGLTGSIGLALFYKSLATGANGVVAPVSAVISAVFPVAFGLVRGESPSTLSMIGIGVAIVAIALIAREPETVTRIATRPVVLAIVAGVFFGIAVTSVSSSSDEGGFWPLLISRAVAIPWLVVTLAATRTALLPRAGDRPLTALGGACDLVGHLVLLTAFRRGLTSLVGPLVALYPAATVILARIVLKERLGRTQLVGVGLALVGVVLVASG